MSADETLPISDEEFQGLYDKARMALHLDRATEALGIAERMMAARPDSTTAHELHGDACVALNKLAEAEQAYRRAMELEPANVDAQRKLGEVVLRIRDGQLQRELLEGHLQERALRGFSDPEPEAAAFRSGLFPGLGQLYNGEYEKGSVLAILGLVCIGFLSQGVFSLLSAEASSPYAALYTSLGGIFGLAVYIYSIWDAARGARDHARETHLYRRPPKGGD